MDFFSWRHPSPRLWMEYLLADSDNAHPFDPLIPGPSGGALLSAEEMADRVADSLCDASVFLLPLFIRRLMIIRFQGRAECDADWRESNPTAYFRPGLEGTTNCDG